MFEGVDDVAVVEVGDDAARDSARSGAVVGTVLEVLGNSDGKAVGTDTVVPQVLGRPPQILQYNSLLLA